MRVKVTLSYDGSAFNGLQKQPFDADVKTVAGTLEEALKRLHIDSTPVASGRTDTGVHALAQVVHFDVPEPWNDLAKLRHYLNRSLMPHSYVKKIEPVDECFNARFDAQKRLYRYIMYEGVYQPFFSAYALHVSSLDVAKLDTLAKLFEGKHAFGFFKKTGGGTTGEERTIFKAGAYRYQKKIILYFLGDAFLRSQIRMMTDMLLKVANGSLSIEDIIAQRDKRKKISSTLAPACGLYLSRIYY